MKRLLLTTTAVAAALSAGAASAADLPSKAPAAAPIYVAPSWEGAWIGGHVGGARMNTSANTTGTNNPIPCGTYSSACAGSDTSFVGGVEAGYDWQRGTAVYGVAADWTWTGLKTQQGRFNNTSAWVNQQKIDWLASFRGRMGLAVQDTLVYITGGLAIGHVKATNTFSDQFGSDFRDYGTITKTKVGWVIGGGVEHRWNRNWSVKAEALYYDLGRTEATATNAGGTYTTNFHHEVIVGRVGVNYRF